MTTACDDRGAYEPGKYRLNGKEVHCNVKDSSLCYMSLVLWCYKRNPLEQYGVSATADSALAPGLRNCEGLGNAVVGTLREGFTHVDVTEEFPFLVTKMLPYYER
jgi:hypothetical protein